MAPVASMAITKEEVITLTKLKISADEIVKAIQKDRTVFNLQVQDILQLKQAGVAEEVIKLMLSTPQLYGDGTGRVDSGGGEQDPVAVTPDKTPEEIAEEQRMIREQAAALAAEAKKARELQRKAYAEGILRKGQELANLGDYVGAIQQFEAFMTENAFQPGSMEAYYAQYGIANALSKAGLLQSAAKSLVDILLQGPDRPFFQQAFLDLRSLRKEISYAPPELEELTSFYGEISKFSAGFQDQYAYTLGEFFYDYSEFSQAIRYLEEVGPNSPDTAKAHYLTGLVQVREKLYRSAIESFQNAILATERNKSSREVSDIAYLALARIAYETGEYDAAIYYYRKVSQDSTKLPQAFYESAWTYFVKGDYSRALGTFQALHSPVFKHYYYPELWVLEGTIYLNLCYTDKVQAALEMFNKDVTTRMGELEGFLRKFRRPAALYNAVVDTMNKVNVSIDEVLLYPVLADVDFFNIYRTIRQIDRELARLETDQQNLGTFGEETTVKLKTLRDEKILEIGTRIQRRLKTTQDQMAEYAVKVTEIEVELDQLVIESKLDELAALGGAEEEGEVEEAAGEAALAIVGADSMQWPFEAEYWVDEIGAYRAFINERCSK